MGSPVFLSPCFKFYYKFYENNTYNKEALLRIEVLS